MINFAQLCSQDIGAAVQPSPTVAINRLGSAFPEPLNTGDALDRYQHVWQKVIVLFILEGNCIELVS